MIHVENDEKEERSITSSDTTVLNGSPDDVFRDIPLLILQPGESIHVKMTSSEATPRKHVRYQQAHAWYRILPRIEIRDMESFDPTRCPRSVFQDGVIRLEECTYCGQCSPFANVSQSDELEFSLTSHMHPARLLLKQAMSLLRENLRQLMDLSNWESDETLPGAFRVTSEMSPIVGQVVIHELSQMENVTFQAIRTPHPLEPTTILRVRTKTDSNPQKEWKAAVVKAMGVLSQWIAMVLAC
jgi:hypothetical protein